MQSISYLKSSPISNTLWGLFPTFLDSWDGLGATWIFPFPLTIQASPFPDLCIDVLD